MCDAKKGVRERTIEKSASLWKKQAIHCIVTLCAGWFIGFLLLWLAFLLPGDKPFQNAQSSLDTLENEGLHYNIGNEYDSYKQDTKLDGYTDLLMINFATNNVQKLSPVQRALSPAWVVASELEDSYDSARLLSFIKNPDSDFEYHYFRRYWTGYIVPVRLLFSLFTFDQIRVVNAICQALLALVCCILVWKKANWQCALALALAYYAMQPVTLSRSLAYSSMFYVSFFGCCIVACTARKHSLSAPPALVFLIIGICTSYFDSLTYPLISLGLPLIVYFSCQGKALVLRPFSKSLGCLVLLCFSWGMGYVGMWAGKWIFAAAAGYQDIFQEVFEATAERTGRSNYSVIQTLLGLEKYCFTRRKIAVLLLPSAVGLLMSLFQIWKTHCWRKSIKSFFLFFLIAILPIGWTVFALNHTSLHWFFTHRIVCVFFSAMIMAVNPCFLPGSLSRGENTALGGG